VRGGLIATGSVVLQEQSSPTREVLIISIRSEVGGSGQWGRHHVSPPSDWGRAGKTTINVEKKKTGKVQNWGQKTRRRTKHNQSPTKGG